MRRRIASVILAAGSSLILSSCGDFLASMNEPLPGGGNALDPPGYESGSPGVEATGPTYAPGEWVETTVPQAALYLRRPKTGDQPAQTLPLGTNARVVSSTGTYVRVELESGVVGYVPEIMVSRKSATAAMPIVPEGPTELLPPPSPLDLAPEPEVPPISVEEAQGVPSLIDPETEDLE